MRAIREPSPSLIVTLSATDAEPLEARTGFAKVRPSFDWVALVSSGGEAEAGSSRVSLFLDRRRGSQVPSSKSEFVSSVLVSTKLVADGDDQGVKPYLQRVHSRGTSVHAALSKCDGLAK